MEVICIRHTSVDVPPGTCYGWSDVGVASTFEEEAEQTKNALRAFGKPDAVFSSPLTRARLLAAHCGYQEPVIDERLKEMNMGEWEMRRYEEIEKTDPSIRLWYDDYMNLAATGGESFPVLYARVSSFLDELRRQPYQQAMLFAHGGVLICAGVYANLFPKEDAFRHLVPFGGVQVIRI